MNTSIFIQLNVNSNSFVARGLCLLLILFLGFWNWLRHFENLSVEISYGISKPWWNFKRPVKVTMAWWLWEKWICLVLFDRWSDNMLVCFHIPRYVRYWNMRFEFWDHTASPLSRRSAAGGCGQEDLETGEYKKNTKVWGNRLSTLLSV